MVSKGSKGWESVYDLTEDEAFVYAGKEEVVHSPVVGSEPSENVETDFSASYNLVNVRLEGEAVIDQDA